jgi:hypothetical protein
VARSTQTFDGFDIMTRRASLRFWFCFSLAAFSAASALGAWGLLHAMRGFQNAEAGGFLTIGRGIAEANRPVIVASYVGAIFTLFAVVGYARSRTLPRAWFALSAFALGFIPFAMFWVTESLLINALLSARNGIIANATLIQRLLFIVLASGVSLSIPLLFAWAVRLTPTATRWRTVVVLGLVITGFIVAAITLHSRAAWIDHMYTHL